jgi:ABC-type branched-subunit amino acid transport system substrate-binding protein
VSGGGAGARIRSLLGLRSLKGAEAIRLVIVVAVAIGVVFLVKSQNGAGHSSSASQHPGQSSPPQADGGTGGSATDGSDKGSPGKGSPGSSASVAVAGGPAVERAIHDGSMTVVIDQPPPGLFAEQNRSIAQGATVAVDQLNARGGLAGHVHVKLVEATLDGLSAAALQAKLRSEAAAVLILPCDTDSQLSLAAAASQFGMLMFAPCNPDGTAGGRYATYWPVGFGANEEALGLTSYMSTVGKLNVFVVSAPGSRYVELVTSDFRNAAQKRGIKIVGSASIPLTTQDFSGLASAIRAAQPTPGAIFTALPAPVASRMAAGLLAEGVRVPLIGTTALDTRGTLSSGAKAVENATFSSYGFPRVNAAASHFAAAYRTRFHSEPVGSFPGLGLETIRLLHAAANKAHSAEPSAIQRALSGGIALEGLGLAGRSYAPDGDHNPVGQVSVSKILAGSFLQLFVVDDPNGPPAP